MTTVRLQLVLVLTAATTLAGTIPLSQPLAASSVVAAAVSESPPPDDAAGIPLRIEAETEEEEEEHGSRRLHLAATTALTLGLTAPCGGCWHHRCVTGIPSRETAFLSRGPPAVG